MIPGRAFPRGTSVAAGGPDDRLYRPAGGFNRPPI